MRFLNQSDTLKKYTSIVLIYALCLDFIIPSMYAMESIQNGYTLSNLNLPQSSVNSAIPTLLNEIENKELEGSEWTKENMTNSSTSISGPGPSSGFSIGSTDELVDKFTGDFSYSIPLMDVEGYPLVLSYNSNVNMLSEASWVGLGWDLNVGSISRDMRGIPDEFNGEDIVVKTFQQKDDATIGDKDGGYLALSSGGYPSFQITALGGKYESSYIGKGTTFDIGLQSSYSISNESNNQGVGLSSNIGLNYDSKGGIGRNQSIGLSKPGIISSITYATSVNSRVGMTSKTLGWGGGKSIKGVSFGFGESVDLPYGTFSTLPRLNYSGKGNSSNMGYDFGISIDLESVTIGIGYIKEDYTADNHIVYSEGKKINQPAYGYLHSGKRADNTIENVYPIMDFNRGFESDYSEEMKNLPFSVQTFDIFHVNALGINAAVRPYRNDVGTYYDPTAKINVNENSTLQLDDDFSELSAGLSYAPKVPNGIGVNIGYSSGLLEGTTESGNWTSTGSNVLEFTDEVNGDEFDAATYFKQVGELTPTNGGLINAFNPTQSTFGPKNFEITASTTGVGLTNNLLNVGNVVSPILNSQIQNVSYGTVFKPYTVSESIQLNGYYHDNIYNYSLDNNTYSPFLRNAEYRKDNHISEIEVIGTNGMKYYYSIPVYSIVSSEVSFAAEGLTTNPTVGGADYSGMVVYTGGVDNSLNNTRGRSYYYDKSEVPSYATTFLLSSITTPDYIDLSDNGPSPDDIGNYYKINNTMVYGGETNKFKWRFPMSGGTGNGFPQAILNRGVLGSTQDDVGNYSYGEKEIWYTRSIESKNLIAVFYLKDREDAYSVNGENGILNDQKPLKCIDSIVLYSHNDFYNSENPIPLQTVKFEYDYSLCPKAPGNLNTYNSSGLQSGKLTLLNIKIYNGNSYENVYHEYNFDYDLSPSINKPFSYNGIDGWGGIREYTSQRPNDIYPYVTQDEQVANQNSQAWKLKGISNPSGGKITIDYEADRYGYVQYKRAQVQTQLYGTLDLFAFLKAQSQSVWNGVVTNDLSTDYTNLAGIESLFGVSPSSLSDLQNIAFDAAYAVCIAKLGKLDFSMVPNNVLIFPLDQPIGSGQYSKVEADQFVKDTYFKVEDGGNTYMTDLYIKTLVNVKGTDSELVPSYVKISKDYVDPFNGVLDIGNLNDDYKAIGVMPKMASGNYEYGYVVIENKTTGNKEKIFGGEDKPDNSTVISALQLDALAFIRQNLPDKVYGSCLNCTPDLSLDWKVFFGGDLYKQMVKSNYANSFNTNLTTMKLVDSDLNKYGGNGRVSRITYYDNWGSISSEVTKNGVYYWDYNYNIDIDSEKTSGVASYEGRQLLDESPFYAFDMYSDVKKKFPDETKFNPVPISEQLFPSPVVGYGKVQVLFSGNIDKGYSETEFYTQKEYKYRTNERKTNIDKSARFEKESFLTGNSVMIYGLSQGYYVTTNDFHGKIKVETIFDRNKNVISRSKYTYYDFNEKLPMIDRQGNIEYEYAGMEYDVHADSRFFHDQTNSSSVGVNLQLYWLLPNPIPTPGLSISKSDNVRERAFYSHTLVQHFNFSAILKSVETEYLGSINVAENTVYDRYSGNTILSMLKDEFNDKLYSLNYPAHWHYTELQDVCSIEQNEFTSNVSIDANGFFIPSMNSILTPGDQVQINGNGTQTYTIAQNFPKPDNGELFLINSVGIKYLPGAGTYNINVVSTNRTNNIDAVMQSVVTKKQIYDGVDLIFPQEQIISADAVKLRDRLTISCGESACNESFVIGMNDSYNPYSLGAMGNLTNDGVFAWQSERQSTDNHGVRFDGTYADFIPFYALSGNKWLLINNVNLPGYSSTEPFGKWRKMGETTAFDHFGKGVEGKDQLGVYSSTLFGYNRAIQTIPVASAINAKHQEIAFDGFEDYDYNYNDLTKCEPAVAHFDFSSSVNTPLSGVAIYSGDRHSGLYSLKISAGSNASVIKQVDDFCEATSFEALSETGFVNNEDCRCVKPFSPISGKKYLFSCWIKDSEGGASVSITGSTSALLPTGPSIDGWRRVEGVFTPISGQVVVSLINANSSSEVLFDDVRIHPYLAAMETTVYDPKTLLPLASHDVNNFTTFYNYDENLNLVRVRVETVEGIRTLSETEYSSKKFITGN